MNRINYGINASLEAVADEILRKALATLPRSQKMDVLTPWKLRDRVGREVYTSDGVPDPAVRKGIYSRSWNPGSPHLNSRDGQVRGKRHLETTKAYIPEQAYTDRAGRVYEGRIRPQSDCRVLTWGTRTRLQCKPCGRFVGSGDEAACTKCKTIYLSKEAMLCV